MCREPQFSESSKCNYRLLLFSLYHYRYKIEESVVLQDQYDEAN